MRSDTVDSLGWQGKLQVKSGKGQLNVRLRLAHLCPARRPRGIDATPRQAGSDGATPGRKAAAVGATQGACAPYRASRGVLVAWRWLEVAPAVRALVRWPACVCAARTGHPFALSWARHAARVATFVYISVDRACILARLCRRTRRPYV